MEIKFNSRLVNLVSTVFSMEIRNMTIIQKINLSFNRKKRMYVERI